jgi:hypothetical protein
MSDVHRKNSKEVHVCGSFLLGKYQRLPFLVGPRRVAQSFYASLLLTLKARHGVDALGTVKMAHSLRLSIN